MNEPHALTQAIQVWRAGRSISIVLFAKLLELGYDVAALERAYRR